jgi:MFS transporter, PAT family, beta-lactamase induction signal transducer AmpG
MMKARPWPAPWVFSLLVLPLGISVGFKFTPLPFLLAQAGVPVSRIATLASVIHLPAVLVVLWAPLVDVRFRRRTWLVIGALGTALGYCLAFPLIGATHLGWMTALILAAGVGDSIVMAACGGLMVRALSAPAQAKASAWEQAGQLGGGALGAAAVIWLTARFPLAAIGVVIAPFIALPALVALTIPEAPPAPSSWFEGRVSQIARQLGALVRSPDCRWGALLLVSPAGTGAAQGLLPAIASHYNVGRTGVMWANGLAGGAVLTFGALASALVPSDWDRRLTYAGACLANGVAALVLLPASRPAFYVVGTILYLLTEGCVWARGVALLVEIVGEETRDASTFFSAVSAAFSVPLLFMIWLDGLGFQKFGARGLLWTDAAPNLAVFVIVALVFAIRGLGLRKLPAAVELEHRQSETHTWPSFSRA